MEWTYREMTLEELLNYRDDIRRKMEDTLDDYKFSELEELEFMLSCDIKQRKENNNF